MFCYIYYNRNCNSFLNIKYDPDFIAAYSVWCSGFGDSWWVQSVHGTTSKMCTQQFEWKWCWCFPLFWIYPLMFCFIDFLRLAPIFTEEHKKLLLNICNSVMYHIQFDRVVLPHFYYLWNGAIFISPYKSCFKMSFILRTWLEHCVHTVWFPCGTS